MTLKGYPQSDYTALYAGKPSFAKKENLGLLANGWIADWPDGYGFLAQLVDSRVIRESGGAYNFSVRDPQIDAMIDAAVSELDDNAARKDWAAIDAKVVEDAWVYPGVWSKSLLYRPKSLTNVFVSSGFGGYDFAALGVDPTDSTVRETGCGRCGCGRQGCPASPGWDFPARPCRRASPGRAPGRPRAGSTVPARPARHGSSACCSGDG